MKLFYEKDQLVSLDEFRRELKSEIRELQGTAPSEEEIENDLENTYQLATANISGMAMADIKLKGVGKKILRKVKEGVCKIIGPNSSSDDIVDAILDVLINLIPLGGVILKPLVKKIAQLIFSQGVGAFCNVPSN